MLSLTGSKFYSTSSQESSPTSKDVVLRLSICIVVLLGAFPTHLSPVEMDGLFEAVPANLLAPKWFSYQCNLIPTHKLFQSILNPKYL